MDKNLYSAAAGAVRGGKRKKNRIRAAVALALAAVFLVLVLVDLFAFPLEYLWAFAYAPDIPPRGDGELRVHFVDVGQGDCTIVEFPDGKSMIVDGGDGSEETRMRAIGYCRALGIDAFDTAVLTHTDADHAGGLDDVLNCFGAKLVYSPFLNGREGDTAFAAFLKAAADAGAEVRLSQMFEAGISRTQENFYYWMMLSPFSPEIADLPAGSEEESTNDLSAVIYLEYAGRALLLTGDASAAVEDRLVDAYAATGGAAFEWAEQAPWGDVLLCPKLEELDFLKAGHHGSGNSTGEALAKLCRPQNLFVSCGAGNGYGHPSLACIGNVLAANPSAEIYRTDELGSIMLTVKADGAYSVGCVG